MSHLFSRETMNYSCTYACLSFFSLTLIGSFLSCSQKGVTTESADNPGLTVPAEDYYTLNDFASVEKYDVHVHVNTTDTAFFTQAKTDNFRLLLINVDVPSLPSIDKQQQLALAQVRAFPQQVAYASTISVADFNQPHWQEQTLAYLKNSFAQGAVGVKVWKNIGMELKDREGRFVMIDHPAFEPVFNFIARNNIPLLSHQGEPRNCWLPVEEMTTENDRRYFSQHPQYHMYLHPDYPSYEDQIQARDRMLEKHPDLQVVSVHLGSLEWNVDELAKRLDKYPHMAVDMAARIPHLHHQAATDWQKVHGFFITYQDRILYGTDLTISPEANPASVQKNAHQTWLNDWQFFVTDDAMSNSSQLQFKGLKLPRPVVDKIYRENARKWIPGLAKPGDKI
jgi:predicted TIM-barrel fold metal-dependent hydrolase